MNDAITKTGVLITDIHSTKEGTGAVYYGKFAMVAPVEPGKSTSERRSVKMDAGYTGFLQTTEIGAGSLDTAEIIIHETDGDTTLGRIYQGIGEELADPVVTENVKFDADVASCSVELAEHGGEKVASIPE